MTPVSKGGKWWVGLSVKDACSLFLQAPFKGAPLGRKLVLLSPTVRLDHVACPGPWKVGSEFRAEANCWAVSWSPIVFPGIPSVCHKTSRVFHLALLLHPAFWNRHDMSQGCCQCTVDTNSDEKYTFILSRWDFTVLHSHCSILPILTLLEGK